jgi:hypothetical protein
MLLLSSVCVWNLFHKTWKNILIANIFLLNWKSSIESYEKLLRKCCNMELSGTVSHNTNFVENAAIFNPEDGDSMFLRNVSIYVRIRVLVSQN